MMMLLDKYIKDPNWRPLQSDALYDLNTVAFENTETSQIDFITLSGNNLDKSPTLLRGKTLLGNFLTDAKAKFNKIPDKVTNGDVELLKLVAFIKANKELFEDKKIGQLYAMNIFKNNKVPRVYTQTLDALTKQWDVLIENVPSTISIKNKDWAIQGVNYTDAFIQDLNTMFDKPQFQSTLGFKEY
jgi:RNAse (barnase) inhibitor barstar